MTRTTVEIDDELIAHVMRRYSLRTKREAVDFALRQLIGEPLSPSEALELEGTGWAADLEELRSSRPLRL